ncbi:MAG: hypothetical protein Q4C10_06430 [Clostridia bacterium]|nr:hypothetical protein [Clostridia bacterium]
MQINIPYSSLLRGSSLRENYGFERRSEPQYFQDLFLVSPNFKRRDNVYGVAGPNGVVYLPVYEIESYAFDRWTVENSHYIFHKRDINYTHAMALDGTLVEGDEAHRDRLRRAIGQVLDNESYFIRADQYVNIAENGETLRGGEMSLYLPDEPAELKPLSQELAELVMRVWQVCWMRMRWMMEKRVAWNATAPRTAPHVEVLAVNAADLPDQTKALSECVRFFREELAPALPPQVMSMLSVAIGCSPNNRDENWPDAACRIYLDGGRFTSRDAANMFDFRGWQEDKRRTPQTNLGASNPNAAWENRLIGYLCEGRYPRFYEAIRRRFGAVDVLADFELLRWCTMSELYIDFFAQAGVAERYKAIQYAAKSLDNVCVLLEMHRVSRAEACLALVDAFDELAGMVERMPELRLAEYDILATAYRALRENTGSERAEAVADRLMGQLGRQIRVPDYEGSAIDFWNEKNGRAELELDPLSLRLVEGELQMLERTGGLSPADFENWCKRYDILSRGGEDALCLRLERELSRQLRFDDPEAPSPLSIAEVHGLDGVAIRIVRGIIQDLYARKPGRLSEQEYRQVLAFYTDTRRNYGDRLEEAAQPARELLCGQFAFEGTGIAAADLLAQQELPELWNRLVASEAQQLAASPQQLDADHFDVWVRRLENESISEECAGGIIAMIVGRAPKENLKQYVETASARQLGVPAGTARLLGELEAALVRGMLEDVNTRQSVSAEDYSWWIGRQQNAEGAGKPFADGIYAMLTRIKLLDDADAKRIAQQAQYWRLLRDLSRASGSGDTVLTVDKFRDWIGYYRALRANDAAASAEVLETIEGMLCRQYRLRSEGEAVYAYDVATDSGADDEMRVRLVTTEYDNSLKNSGLVNAAGAKRWVEHYAYLRRQGSDKLADDVAGALCGTSTGMVGYELLNELMKVQGADDLEGRLLDREKAVAQVYSDEEYGERLHRLLGGTDYKNAYIALLEDASKCKDGEAFDRFVRCLKERLDEINGDNAPAVTDIFSALAKSAQAIRPETRASLREMAGNPAMQGILKADQAGLGRVIRESLNDDHCRLDDLRTLYKQLEKRLPELDEKAAGELAESAFADGDLNSFKRYCPDPDDETKALLERTVQKYIKENDIDGEALPKAARTFDAVGLPGDKGLALIAEALKKAKGPVRVDALGSYAKNTGEPARQALLEALAKWTSFAEKQPPETLNALAECVKGIGIKVDGVLKDSLLEGLKTYLGRNDFSGATEKTYEWMAGLWKGREDFDAVAMPLLNGIEALSVKMRDELRARMGKGPVHIDAQYSRVAAMRDALELDGFLGLIQDAATLNEMTERGSAMAWIDRESLARAASTADGQRRLTELVARDFDRRIDDLRISGEKLPVACGLTRVAALLGDERFGLYAEILEPHVDRLIQDKSLEAFHECCQAYDGQSRAACEGFAQLKALLERVKADDSKPLSVSTAAWCGEYATAVLGRGTLDRRKAEEVLRSLHRDRRDMGNLREFCGRVYQISLAHSEIRSEIDVLLLLCAAKARDYNDVWNRYLLLAMKLGDDGSIWKDGHDTDISTIVVFTYDALAGYGDDEAVSQMSLADFCAKDSGFSDLQKRQKNAALKAILQKSTLYTGGHKGGLFGFLRR